MITITILIGLNIYLQNIQYIYNITIYNITIYKYTLFLCSRFGYFMVPVCQSVGGVSQQISFVVVWRQC